MHLYVGETERLQGVVPGRWFSTPDTDALCQVVKTKCEKQLQSNTTSRCGHAAAALLRNHVLMVTMTSLNDGSAPLDGRAPRLLCPRGHQSAAPRFSGCL